MNFNELPTFFKRRFDKELFEKELLNSMAICVKGNNSMFRDFEVNVINETLSNYFWDVHNMDLYVDVELGEVYKFEDFVTQNYLQSMIRFWHKHKD
jgi:hypothetical protein